MKLETENLYLLSADIPMLQAALAADEALANMLKIHVPARWSEFGPAALQYSLAQLQADPASAGWWTYLPILKNENTLIGSGGYKGRPHEGMVEIGYEISAPYRGRGYATEMAQALVSHAFTDKNVQRILAHTLARENASTRVLKKCGFTHLKELIDPDDGAIWQWELKRSS